MAERQGFIDGRRVVLEMQGTDARAVLQGVVTNDVDLVAAGRAVYAALLTPQGKYLADFFLLDGGDGSVLIDVAVAQAQGLAQRLKMYCLRRDARIGVREGMVVGCIWGGGPGELGGDVLCLPDPRDPALGWRVYGPESALASVVRDGAQTAYDTLRVAHLVPESGVELVPDQTYILEAGFERLSGVDFRKGCYVGQEVTARMKHKTELRKGLVAVSVSGEAEPGTPVTAEGKPVGTLYSVADGRGLAHLRLDRAGTGMQAGDATVDYLS